MGIVLLPVGGVDHRQIGLLSKLVNHQVVNGAPLGIAHDAVPHLVHGHAAVIVGEQVIQRVQGRGAGEENLPHGVFAAQGHLRHVGDVEQARLLADGHVLLDDAGSILHRQQVASEGDHLAALCHMDIIEWGFSFHCVRSFSFSCSSRRFQKTEALHLDPCQIQCLRNLT